MASTLFRKTVLYGAVKTDQIVPPTVKSALLMLPSAPSLNSPDLRTSEKGSVEFHRLLGDPVKHEERCNIPCALFLPTADVGMLAVFVSQENYTSVPSSRLPNAGEEQPSGFEKNVEQCACSSIR